MDTNSTGLSLPVIYVGASVDIFVIGASAAVQGIVRKAENRHLLRRRSESGRLIGMELHGRESEGTPARSGREHVIVRPGYCGGKPHVAGTRIKVQHIAIWHERMGMSPEEIAATYPGLTMSDVYAALTYYYDHREQIYADIEADDRFVAARTGKAGPSPLQQKLAALRGENDSLPPG
jgi:uncharacterized protein (DUF433 family)